MPTRLLYYTDFKGYTKEIFFKELGITYGGFKGNAKNQSLRSDSIERIITKYPDINPIWLLTGKGEMIIDEDVLIMLEGNPKTDNTDKYILALERENNLLTKEVNRLENENEMLKQEIEKMKNY